ncbi:uncharacterized protein LOC111310916 isoform X2 [Durio zibethinus]|uniref:Uncharacterized protein LOC111310916 isoform X2 n=1 Tax=Durio zibethinus TaxID=66656 RepID=A0A6P6AMC8_DURZI|nr:uncharacterized protein LOC111310916 isoform X2 [Durio zibethinus]
MLVPFSTLNQYLLHLCSILHSFHLSIFYFFSLAVKIYVCGCGSSGFGWFSRKKSVTGAELGTGSLSPPTSSHQAGGSWGEGEKAFPLKKRRGSFERRGNDDDKIMEKDTHKKVMINTNKMKTKMNKKFVQPQNDNEQEEIKEIKDSASTTTGDNNNNNNPSSAKKRGRGGALMEGSRCSRVNGRGWRCCQQTLVGYSLCEHHLGKGRLRSMTSVRSRSLASSNAAAKEEPPNNNDHHDQPLSNCSSPFQQAKQTQRELLGESGENENEDQEDQKPLMMTKKRVKLGMVKARSISSLLGQNDNAFAVADDNN